MFYVVDNNIFSHALNNQMPFDVFDIIWKSWERLIEEQRIVSVSEVLCELEVKWSTKKGEEWDWLTRHKECFVKPTNEECEIVSEIFRFTKFREGVKERSIRAGTPEADAFLVAKAKAIDGIVVTAEKDAPHSEKIPCIASKFDVPYMKEKDFFRMLRNIHDGNDELKNVAIYHELGVPTLQK